MQKNFVQQFDDLQAARYPIRLILAVAKSLYRNLKKQNRPRNDTSLL